MNFDDPGIDNCLIDDEKLLSCSLCDKRFDNEKRYFGHLRVHSGEISWVCQRCPSTPSFDSQSRLRNHENSCHSLVRPYKCDKCRDTFDRASQLNYHKRSVHLREKSQICQICGKGFFRKADLRTHLNVHLGTDQSICEICGRKFNHVSNLIRHCRTHAGAKPYPCSLCGKRFTQISSLARHKRIHERESGETSTNADETPSIDGDGQATKRKSKRRHYCRTCGESFEFMVLLKRHKRLHAKVNEDCEKMESIDENMAMGNDSSANSMGNHIMELAGKVNSMETDTERDVSISISDILSPYNCDEIELSNGVDDLEEKLYDGGEDSSKENMEKVYDIAQCLNDVDFQSSVDSHLSNSSMNELDIANSGESNIDDLKSNIRADKFFNAEDSQLYVEICQSDYLENSQICELGDGENVEESEKIEKINDSISEKGDGTASDAVAKIDIGEPTLRLVKTDTGEQFYELVVNSRSDENLENNFPLETESLLENSGAASMSTEDCRLMGKGNFNELDKLSEVDNDRDATMLDETNQMPMVRLVQNEDGEQFFELVREPLDYEKNRTIDNRDKSIDSTSNDDQTRISKIGKRKASMSTLRKENSGKRTTQVRGRKFKCTECDKSFSTSYNFKQHAGTHFSDQQKFHCKECGLTFAWKSTLNKHLAGNHRPDGPQKFVCEICPKVYSTLSQVNEHVKRDHLKERNHVCTLCGKSFFKKFDLKTHARTHTNERPYICRACGKGFHHQSHIIRHERIHSGERPYECDICQRTFTQPGSLKSHRQRHRDVKIDILEYRMDEDDPLTLAVQ